MNTVIYHNPRCAKSRETLELLRSRGVEPQIVEYLKTPPDRDTFKSLLKKLGMKARALLRTKEAEYKTARLDDPSLTEDHIISTMIKYPILIERPIVVVGDKAALGRPPENVLELLK